MVDAPTDCALSSEKKEMVDRLYVKLQDLNHDQSSSRPNLIRWLRSRNWNEVEAEKMLRAHISWRREHEVDTILSWYQMPEVIDKYFPGGICGEDKEGRPLFIAPVGRVDPKSFLKATNRLEFLQSRIFQMEHILHVTLPEATARAGKEIDQLTVIMDMQGLGLKHLSPSWLSLVGEAVTVIESNYPEVLGACFVINAPPLFTRLYSFVKPLLSKATQEKVQVLDSNYPETLLRHCDAESLPAVYGGSLIDPDGDPRCPSRICWAGPVPDSYMNQSKQPLAPPPVIRVALSRSASAQSLGSSEQFSVIEVARGGQRDIPVGFLPVGVELCWCILCESHDIGVGWFVRPCDVCPVSSNPLPLDTNKGGKKISSSTLPPHDHLSRKSSKPEVNDGSTTDAVDTTLWEVLPIQRIATRLTPHKGKFKVHLSGSYYLRLDNSYSWMRVKRVQYTLKVIVPKDSTRDNAPLNLSPRHSTDVPCHSNLNSRFADSWDTISTTSGEGTTVRPLPLENASQCRLVTGGSMDVNISLLFRLLAQVLLVPKMSSYRQSTG
ncbi:hypothetical protein CRM22_006567 [Opisthorchis felineus]|uniref:CRAL-TRIO domain-containing protein n=1 Tax=Opisthorchis felineus TaxID=147828 RepID=A0A4S2LK66_OPIFE|nr:hypothetical protein CRM22_006567 [Opisthorchis felineus]